MSEKPWGIIKFQKLPEIFHAPGFFHGAKLWAELRVSVEPIKSLELMELLNNC
jgi:hypothetical protein